MNYISISCQQLVWTRNFRLARQAQGNKLVMYSFRTNVEVEKAGEINLLSGWYYKPPPITERTRLPILSLFALFFNIWTGSALNLPSSTPPALRKMAILFSATFRPFGLLKYAPIQFLALNSSNQLENYELKPPLQDGGLIVVFRPGGTVWQFRFFAFVSSWSSYDVASFVSRRLLAWRNMHEWPTGNPLIFT